MDRAEVSFGDDWRQISRPVSLSSAKASTRPGLSSAVVTKRRLPTTTGDECPRPGTSVRHLMFCSSLQTAGQRAFGEQLLPSIPASRANRRRRTKGDPTSSTRRQVNFNHVAHRVIHWPGRDPLYPCNDF